MSTKRIIHEDVPINRLAMPAQNLIKHCFQINVWFVRETVPGIIVYKPEDIAS